MECFVVYRDEIEGRIDPLYYSTDILQILKKTRFEIKTIGNVAVYVKTGFPAGSNLQSHNGQGVIQIRPTNIDEDNLLNFEKNIYIKPEIAEKKKSELLKKGEVLFNNTNSQDLVGKTAYFDLNGDYFCSNHITRIKVNEDKVLPKYLWILLNLYQKSKVFFKLCTNWNNQSGINIELLKAIKIPIPTINEQKKIIDIYENGLNLKKQKETEARQLLDSINDYVLSELGIKIPELRDQMTFVAYADNVKSGRFDPYYYQPKFKEVEKAIENGKYKVRQLRESFENGLIKGTLPKENEKNGEIKVLQIKNILTNGLIDISEYLTAKNIFSPDQKISKGDIIIVITGATIGKIGLWYLDEDFYLGGDMIKFTPSKDFDPFYVQSFLLSQAGQFQILREITGATNKHLSPSSVEKIKIPFPPLEIQNKIAEEVKKRMEKAEQLQEEAKEVLEKVRQEVENIILNGEDREN